MALGVDSASNRNEYQEHFLVGKGGRCVRLTTLPPSCAVVTKSGNLNFLEPSGPVTGLIFIMYNTSLLYRNSQHPFHEKEEKSTVTATCYCSLCLAKVIRSFTLFSVYPYTGKVPRMWKLSK